jgi:cysteine-rich repeat protein
MHRDGAPTARYTIVTSRGPTAKHRDFLRRGPIVGFRYPAYSLLRGSETTPELLIMISRIGAASLFLLASCTAGDQSDQQVTTSAADTGDEAPADDPGPAPGPVPLPYPSFSFVNTAGEWPNPQGLLFALQGDAYLNATSYFLLPNQPPPPDPPQVVPGDFYFDVTSGGGAAAVPGSLDDRSCRRVHIDSDGNIDQVYAGLDGCQHPFVADPTGRGKLLVQIGPFRQSAIDPNGNNSLYCVSFERVTPIAGGGSPPDGYCFFVFGSCGDGIVSAAEACDDGNTADGDGCSAVCAVEPPPAGTCGDGCVDAGEACDDGNTTDGDGCSATCTVEPACDDPHMMTAM